MRSWNRMAMLSKSANRAKHWHQLVQLGMHMGSPSSALSYFHESPIRHSDADATRSEPSRRYKIHSRHQRVLEPMPHDSRPGVTLQGGLVKKSGYRLWFIRTSHDTGITSVIMTQIQIMMPNYAVSKLSPSRRDLFSRRKISEKLSNRTS
jgi:hypothetical protein